MQALHTSLPKLLDKEEGHDATSPPLTPSRGTEWQPANILITPASPHTLQPDCSRCFGCTFHVCCQHGLSCFPCHARLFLSLLSRIRLFVPLSGVLVSFILFLLLMTALLRFRLLPLRTFFLTLRLSPFLPSSFPRLRDGSVPPFTAVWS